MNFIIGKSDTISNPAFMTLKVMLSVLSVVLTTAFVALLETHA